MRDRTPDRSGVGPEPDRRGPRLGDVAEYVSDEVDRARADEPPPVFLPPTGWRHRVTRLKRRVGFRTARSKAILLRWRGRLRAHPLGRVGVKLAVALLGTLVVAVGVILLPLPGPGWVIILTGLAILALEFHWARRLLHFTRQQLRRWTRLVREGSWPVRVTSVLAVLLVIGGVMWLSYRVVA